MRKNSKIKVLQDLEKSIESKKEVIELLESLKVNKTKNGEYFKTISKAGIDAKDKKYMEIGYDTYIGKYYLHFLTHSNIYFADYKDLEKVRDEQLEKAKSGLIKLQEHKDFALNNYEALCKKLFLVHKNLTPSEKELLNYIDVYLALSLEYIIH